MNTSNNIIYNTTLSLVTALSISSIHANSSLEKPKYMALSSYEKGTDYTTIKQSTVDNSTIKNDIEMLKLLEIEDFNNRLQTTLNTSIIKTWIPADNLLEKSCLFIKVENQEELIKKFDDLELELYLALEEKIDKSNFFDMVAII